MTAFVFRNHAIETADIWLPTHPDANGVTVGPHAKLMRAWVVVEGMMALVPPYLADTETDAQLEIACATLNAIAQGSKDVDDGIASIEEQKLDIQKKIFKSKRIAAVRLGVMESLFTAGFAALTVAAYYGLRYLDWAGANVFWTDVENAISATGFGVFAFAIAVLLRRLYASREDKIEEISEFMNKGWKPWELALINFVLVIISVGSIFFGIKLVDNFQGFGLIATPGKALLPGFLLGIAAPRVLNGFMGR